MSQLKDAGILIFRDGKLHFRTDHGDEIRVAQMAQLTDHSDPSVTSLIGRHVTIFWSAIHEVDNSLFLLAHKVIRHQDIAERAFEISQSNEGGTAVDNWLHAEDELLGFSPT